MEEKYSIQKLLMLMLSKIWWIILAAVICGGAAFSYSEFYLPLKYQSYTSLYVKNTNAVNETGNINVNDLNTAKNLASTYIVILSDDAVMQELGDRFIEMYGEETAAKYFRLSTNDDGESYIKPGVLRNCIQMSAVNSTEVIRVTVITTSAQISADICNLIADIAPDFLVRVVGAGSVEAIGEARVNEVPVSPNKKKNTAVGILAGIVIAAGIIFLIDFFDTTIKDKEELADKFKKPIIGEIQSFYGDKHQKKKTQDEIYREARNTLLNKDIPFSITESYKAMRTNLMFSMSTSDKKVIAVSSGLPGEGKSTTAANLAIALAQADKKVLLIDGDMRKPVQHRTFGLKNKMGLSNVLGKMNSFEDCVQKTKAKNLDLLSSGPKPPNPSELLASVQTEKLFNRAAEDYDYVIIDTPPVNVVSDAVGLNNYIAGIILVLKYASTTFEEVQASMDSMELADSNVLGFVINEISAKDASYGGYKYKYKYKYKSKYGYRSGYDYSSYGYGSDYKSDDSDDKPEEKKSEEKKSEEKKSAEKKTETKKSDDKSSGNKNGKNNSKKSSKKSK